MKRITTIALVLIIVGGGVSMADNIGENFDAGGVALGGCLRFAIADLHQYLYLRATASMLVVRGLALGLIGEIDFYDSEYGDVVLGSELSYTFGYDPDASSGLAFTIGVSVQAVSTLVTGIYGEEYRGEYIAAAPSASIDWFVNPRVSVQATVRGPELLYDALLYDALQFDIGDSVDFFLGAAYHIPNRDAVVGSTRNAADQDEK